MSNEKGNHSTGKENYFVKICKCIWEKEEYNFKEIIQSIFNKTFKLDDIYCAICNSKEIDEKFIAYFNFIEEIFHLKDNIEIIFKWIIIYLNYIK